MRTIASILLPLSLAACSATPPDAEEPAPATTAHAVAQTKDAPVVAVPPPGAAGKISADMVGKVSPVPALMGHGEHFNIEVQADDAVNDHATGDLGHRVQLVLGMGAMKAEGVLFYRGPKPAPTEQTLVLEGQLDTSPKPTSLRVEILHKACVDDADQPFPHTVVVTVGLGPQGKGMRMHGCGELAMY